jgi:hypothetical protein
MISAQNAARLSRGIMRQQKSQSATMLQPDAIAL